MSSHDNDIHADIRELLGWDTLTPEMESVVSVMLTHRPRVDIDKWYKHQLQQQLLKSSSRQSMFPQFSYAWMWWMSTACAALILAVGVWRVLAPTTHETQFSEQTVESWGAVMSSMLYSDMESDIWEESSATLSEWQTAKISPDASPESLTPWVQTESMTLARMETPETTSDTPMESSIMMATPENTRMMMETPSADMPIDSEMQDMMWDIRTIIQDAQLSSIVLPEYPREMSIYTKTWIYTPDEKIKHTGSGIVEEVRQTYTREDMEKRIRADIWESYIVGSPEIYYHLYQEWDISTLVPTLQYSLSTWIRWHLSLVPWYE